MSPAWSFASTTNTPAGATTMWSMLPGVPRRAAIVEDLDPADAGEGRRQRLLAPRALRPGMGRLRLVGDRQDQAADPFPEATLDPTLAAEPQVRGGRATRPVRPRRR